MYLLSVHRDELDCSALHLSFFFFSAHQGIHDNESYIDTEFSYSFFMS